MRTYNVKIPVVVTVEADDEAHAIVKASFRIGHGVHYVYGGEWVDRLTDEVVVTEVDES